MLSDDDALAAQALALPPTALSEDERRALAARACPALLAAWGDRRSYLQDVELTRLGLLAGHAPALRACAKDALYFLSQQFDQRRRLAAEWAAQVIAALDAAGAAPDAALLRQAALACEQVGDVARADAFRERALTLIAAGAERGALLLDHGRRLVEKGEPERALSYLEEARQLAPTERDRAVTLGDIARIQAAKGEVDAALALYREILAICEALGDMDGIANTLWAVAQIELQRQQGQPAYDHLARSYEILLRLGRLDGICVVGLDLGQLLAAAGHADDARQLFHVRGPPRRFAINRHPRG